MDFKKIWENRGFIFMILISLIFVVFMPRTITMLKQTTGEEYSQDCSISKFNIYSNSTEAYESFFGDKCYIKTYDFYETNKVCGTFGISCYESSEPHYESYTRVICFNKKTGELC